MQNEELECFLCGRVQGVAFRYFTEEKAEALGLTGFCENSPDGRLHVVAQGERKKLETLLAFLRVGPPYAEVINMETFWREAKVGYSDFSVHR